MSNGERQCSKCDFYDPKSKKCHFQPPVFQYVFKPNGPNTGNVEREGGWPSVRPEEWCGQFKAKP